MLPHDNSVSGRSSLSWMDDRPLYSHLDRERCVWVFSKWLPVEDWLGPCGGRRQQAENHTATSSINITVHSAYIQHDYQLDTYILTGMRSEMVAQIGNSTNRAVFLPPPIHTLPENRDKLSSNAYIFPIAVQQSSTTSETTVLQVYFYSILPLRADRKSYTAAIAGIPPTLLHTDTIGNTSKQVWLWEFAGAVLPMTIPVLFYPTSDHALLCEADCATVSGGDENDGGALRFSLAVTSSNDGGSLYRPAFRASAVTAQHDPDVVSNHTEPFTLGKKLNNTLNGGIKMILRLVDISLRRLVVK